MSKGSTLHDIQNGKPKLIAYVSKILPEVARNYLITELELCGLAINIASFSHLLKKVDFDTIVDHLTLTHIIKSKVELVTTRIKRLLEIISSYSFNLYYIKGNVEVKPRLEQGRAGVKCKKPQVTRIIDATTDKLQGTLSIPTVQKVPKNSLDFPMHEQSINSSKTEGIT